MNIRFKARRSTSRRRIGAIAAGATAAAALLSGLQLADAAAKPRVIPASVAVPAGNVLLAETHAQGFQIYVCQVQGMQPKWVLQQPQAVLADHGPLPFALHYGGPSWTAMDGSTVVATKAGDAPAPAGNAIPWLLLAKASTSGPEGGTLVPTTFIQRINTTGGLAPSSGCDAGHVGATTPVFYTADYLFYRAG